MNGLDPQQSRTFTASLIAAFLLHGGLVLALLFSPAFRIAPQDAVEVLMVRLQGGGENRPGWIKPTTASPDQAKVSDGKPKANKTPPAETVKPTSAESKPKPLHAEPAREETKSTPEAAATEQPASDATSLDTGEGVGNKPCLLYTSPSPRD